MSRFSDIGTDIPRKYFLGCVLEVKSISSQNKKIKSKIGGKNNVRWKLLGSRASSAAGPGPAFNIRENPNTKLCFVKKWVGRMSSFENVILCFGCDFCLKLIFECFYEIQCKLWELNNKKTQLLNTLQINKKNTLRNNRITWNRHNLII